MGRIERPASVALVATVAAMLSGGAGTSASLAEEMAAHAAGAAGSETVEIVGAVRTSRIYGPADLGHEPVTTETVYFGTGKGPVRATFTGVLLWTLLQEAGIATDPAVKNDILRHTVTVTGADGYRVVLSAGELDPEFGGEPAILAYARDGQPLGTGEGFARLIVPGDKGRGRNVSGVARVEVR